MDPDVRSSIETYIEKLREELIQEIQGMNSETVPSDTGLTLGLGSLESSIQERLACAASFSGCAK
ncbi:MAG TPA: hypothetical protein VLB68_12570 [Pyrinomonadaceae bacterium]|nr:hypothetical protein [Pyrinomonadaceae bacterium]